MIKPQPCPVPDLSGGVKKSYDKSNTISHSRFLESKKKSYDKTATMSCPRSVWGNYKKKYDKTTTVSCSRSLWGSKKESYNKTATYPVTVLSSGVKSTRKAKDSRARYFLKEWEDSNA